MTSQFGRRYDRERIHIFTIPASIRWLGHAALGVAALICLNAVVTFFLAAYALSGRENIKLKLPLIARAIQWTEFAISIVALAAFDLYFLVSQRMQFKELNSFYSQPNVRFERKCLIWCWFPNRLALLAVWIILVVFQSQYVPILGHETLSDCTGLFIDKKRCNALNGTYVAAIIYCVLYSTSLAVSLALILRLRCSENEFDNPGLADETPNTEATRSAFGGSSTRGPYVSLASNDRP